MTHQSKPNSWVFRDTDSTTQLSYALQINPAPFTVSIPDTAPVTGSLEFVITNPTNSSVNVTSVSFILKVGSYSDCITQSTSGILTSVNDTTNWIFSGPPSPITNGSATYLLTPASGNPYLLPAGASVVVQIFGFQTLPVPGNSTLNIKELIVSLPPAYCSFMVSTFPTGFYFNGLAATVTSGSRLVPMAQVNTGSTVTLSWNSSVVDTGAFTIYYSNATNGQQTEHPADIGEWTSPPLSSDTVFTVAVTISAEGGQPLTASMSTSVSVQNPSLVAAGITTGTATVTGSASIGGTLSANAITATGATVNGTVAADALSANSAIISGSLNTSGLSASTATITGNTSAQNVSAGGTLTVAGVSTFNGEAVAGSTVSMMQSWIPINTGQTYNADTDGFLVGAIGYSPQAFTLCITQIRGLLNGICMMIASGGNMVYSNGPHAITSWDSPNCMLMPVPKGSTFMLQVINGGNINAPTSGFWVPLGKSGIQAVSDIADALNMFHSNQSKAQPMDLSRT